MAKSKELQNKSPDELAKTLKEKQNRLLELRFGSSVQKVKDASEKKIIRKDIARILTLLNNK